MKRHITAISLTVVMNSIMLVQFTWAGDIPGKAKEILDTIITNHRKNNTRINDLYLSGTYTLEGTEHREITFKCFRLGKKKRIDFKHTEKSDVSDVWKENEVRWALTEKGCWSYLENTGLASKKNSSEFHLTSPATWLDTASITPAYDSHVSHIEYLLDRWDSGRDNITIETEAHNEATLYHITYDSNRGGKLTTKWQVDSSRGFQIVSCHHESFRMDGSRYLLVNAEYSTKEVQKGVWKAVGCKVTQKRYNKDGVSNIATISICPIECQINSGQIDEKLFSIKGLGIPESTIVTDKTRNPAM